MVKPRTISVTLDMGEPVAADGVSIDKNGEVALLKGGQVLVPKAANIQTGYKRKKGLKVLNQANLQVGKLIINPNEALLKYELVFAVDTNTVILNNEYLSVSCIALCKFIRAGTNAIAQFAATQCLEFRGVSEKSENIAWVKVIQMIIGNPAYDPIKKIGVVVDSDLGNIPEFNSGSKPIHGDFFLPENFELVYASADTGKAEYLANKLISICDKEASGLIRYLQNNPTYDNNLEKVTGVPYTHFRLWNK